MSFALEGEIMGVLFFQAKGPGKADPGNGAGQPRPRLDQRASYGRKSSTKTPALGLPRPRNRLGSLTPHCLGPNVAAPGYIARQRELGYGDKGPID